jgi:hypothetical protein
MGWAVGEAKSGSERASGDSKSAAIWPTLAGDSKRQLGEIQSASVKSLRVFLISKKIVAFARASRCKSLLSCLLITVQFANFGERGKKKRRGTGRQDAPLYPSGLPQCCPGPDALVAGVYVTDMVDEATLQACESTACDRRAGQSLHDAPSASDEQQRAQNSWQAPRCVWSRRPMSPGREQGQVAPKLVRDCYFPIVSPQ